MKDTILVVDDHPVNLKLLRVLLSAEGYDVREATDALGVLAGLRLFTPKLILMDIQLPGLDGHALTRLLKANPRTAGLVIVAVTAYAMKGDEQRMLAAGCDGYLAKPIDTRLLPGLVEGYLRDFAEARL